MAELQFRRAQKQRAKARINLIGPPKAGKTYTALQIARGLVGPNGTIAVIDTENASASKYADDFEFDVLELDSYDPLAYCAAIAAAEQAGYDALIVDSATHAWAGKGGILEQKDAIVAGKRGGAESDRNEFTAWAKVNPAHNAFVDALMRCRCHLIVTLRSKVAYAIEPDPQKPNKTRVVRLGERPIQREGFEYEFDVVAELDHEHHLSVTGTRCRALDGFEATKPGPELGRILADWLNEGAEPMRQIATPKMEAFDAAADRLSKDFLLLDDDQRRINEARTLARAGYVEQGVTKLRALYAELGKTGRVTPGGAPSDSSGTPKPPKQQPSVREQVQTLHGELEQAELTDEERDALENAWLMADADDPEGAKQILEQLAATVRARKKDRNVTRNGNGGVSYRLEREDDGQQNGHNGHEPELHEARAATMKAYLQAFKRDSARAKTALKSVGWQEAKDIQACVDIALLARVTEALE